MRRLAAALAAALLLALPASAATPTPAPRPDVPPAGTVVVVVFQSDGMSVMPVAQGTVPPLACLP